MVSAELSQLHCRSSMKTHSKNPAKNSQAIIIKIIDARLAILRSVSGEEIWMFFIMVCAYLLKLTPTALKSRQQTERHPRNPPGSRISIRLPNGSRTKNRFQGAGRPSSVSTPAAFNLAATRLCPRTRGPKSSGHPRLHAAPQLKHAHQVRRHQITRRRELAMALVLESLATQDGRRKTGGQDPRCLLASKH